MSYDTEFEVTTGPLTETHLDDISMDGQEFCIDTRVQEVRKFRGLQVK